MPSIELGDSIPPNTAHAVSVSLPTWKSNVGYEEGEQWVLGTMVTGYPRFFIHKSIQAFGRDIAVRYGASELQAILFPTKKTANRCLDFIRDKAPQSTLANLCVIHLVLDPAKKPPESLLSATPSISAVLCSAEAFPFAKQYWQHSGDGVSSRRAEFCHGLFNENILVPEEQVSSPRAAQQKLCRGPKRYRRTASIDHNTTGSNGTSRQFPVTLEAAVDNGTTDSLETSRFLEERYGRNLDLSLVPNAKSAIRRRIAGVLTTDVDLDSATAFPTMDSNARGISNFKEDDIYLVPCGMNAIFTTHQTLLKAREPRKSINFGFPYVDTLKILQKFGPGAIFYGHGSSSDLDDLERRLRGGEKFLGLFCEFPGNPLLTCPDLARIRRLADSYDFAVVVDETVGTFVNVNVLPFADVVVSSLTKIFSGDCNVMGGSIILNPNSRYYDSLKSVMTNEFEDTYWAEDVIFMERNSRDFKSRIDRVNTNAEAICDVLNAHPLVTNVYYPKYNESRPNYEVCKLPSGGYGGLLSCTLMTKAHAMAFFDALETAKGPSLGTNFTLTSPYVVLAHYQELEWAAGYGVSPDLLRVSVGLEDDLTSVFANALKVAETCQASE
ncbi:PLP-dependent transferase [Annulohypoxylon maeteangense]|uniref:PLP-dependent transferase n=1 Tax=Annulohypoxylon maeteangense TaxID=1927788 RepID=UPI002008E018|nr:PLP-dependent transferase [Annulohypoxylon maeteangense]KAI0881004.1 PLP-dependent transferase [Annulohypoxylon maeteangense]